MCKGILFYRWEDLLNNQEVLIAMQMETVDHIKFKTSFTVSIFAVASAFFSKSESYSFMSITISSAGGRGLLRIYDIHPVH
jgi:hypothetical protein